MCENYKNIHNLNKNMPIWQIWCKVLLQNVLFEEQINRLKKAVEVICTWRGKMLVYSSELEKIWVKKKNYQDSEQSDHLVLLHHQNQCNVSPWSTELFNLNFQSLVVVSRYRDTQLQVTENVCDLWNSSPNIFSVSRLKAYFSFNTWLYRCL